ncbi:putative DNA binding protein [Thermoplasmatales archaeon BRNA1]|nr:putative DNA binding protein [Thermoplasmatales archaeon BRNA1]
MYYCRLAVDRTMPYEEHPCRNILPLPANAEGVSLQVVKCSSIDSLTGYSLIRIITDGKTDIPEGKHETDGGECVVEKISSSHYTASVTNRKCFLSSLFSESKCFLMSSTPMEDGTVEWTVTGQDSAAVHTLTHKMKDLGYRVKFLAGGKFGDEMTLTPKEERYVKSAYDKGYYDVPRRIDLDGLCEALGCSKSTLNVALRTAERKLIAHYLDGSDKASKGSR